MNKQKPKKAKRTSIPISSKREVIQNALGKCSFPGCKEDGIKLQFHHIDGNRSSEKDHKPFNLLLLCANHHIEADRHLITEVQCYNIKNELASITSNIETFGFDNYLKMIKAGLLSKDFQESWHEIFILEKYLIHNRIRISDNHYGNIKLIISDIKMSQGEDSIAEATEAYKYFKKSNNIEGMIQARSIQAINSEYSKDFVGAEFYYNDTLNYIESIEETHTKSHYLRWMNCYVAKASYQVKNFHKAQEYIDKSFLNYQELTNPLPEWHSETYLRLANLYHLIGDKINSERNYLRSKRIAEISNQVWIKTMVYRYLIQFYSENNRIEEAINLVNKLWPMLNKSFLRQKIELYRLIYYRPKIVTDEILEYLSAKKDFLIAYVNKKLLTEFDVQDITDINIMEYMLIHKFSTTKKIVIV